MSKSPKEMYEAIMRNLRRSTGKSLDEWMELVRKRGPKERKEQREWLRIKHNLGNGQASTIVKMMNEGLNDYDEGELMKQHFNNGKDYQKEIYDKLIATIRKWGNNKVAVNKTYLSLIHNHQFALVKTTKEGMVIGVPGTAVRAAKSKEFIVARNLGSDKITHKILMNDVSDVTDGVISVLKASYDNC